MYSGSEDEVVGDLREEEEAPLDGMYEDHNSKSPSRMAW